MKSKITWLVVIVFVIGAVIIIWNNAGKSPSNSGAPSSYGSSPITGFNPGGPMIPATSTSTTGSTSSASSTTQSYTLADVAAHNTSSSCWTAINGKVYDVTSWISEHPGGPEHITQLCGTDGSAAFNDQHSGQGAPAKALAQFYVGDLAQ